MKLAAIDIGSNAARLLIQEVNTNEDGVPEFTKINLIRIPLRLGFEVFNDGKIGKRKIDDLINTMRIYQLAMKIHGVDHYRACATSAMRDASNGKYIMKRIMQETGINLEIISGSEEAQIIYENHLNAKINHNANYLYIDVGGGSTEITLMEKDAIKFKASFNIGTIRLLNRQITAKHWAPLKSTVHKIVKDMDGLIAIGSGGNINKVFSLSKTKENRPLTLTLLENMYELLEPLSVAERIKLYNLKEDRADVIVPALKIYISIMKWAGIEKILVPKIGVADGIIKLLYAENTLDV